MRRKGITLMELVVVVSIIAVLLGLAVIGISEIRWRTGVTQCVSNLSQIGLALRMYAQDWNGFAPPYYAIIIPEGEEFEQSVKLVEAFMPYTKSEDIWICPRDVWNGIEWKGKKYRGRFGFTSYHVDSRYGLAPRYGFGPINVDAPPIILPFEYLSGWEETRKCAICMALFRDYFRWIYATDGGSLGLNHKKLRGDRVFMIYLLLSGRVKVWWRPNNPHLNFFCPTEKLPGDWPFRDFS